MIGVVASLIAAVLLRNYAMLAAPVVFVIALRKRDLGLVAYFLYAVYTASKVPAGDLYLYEELIGALVFALSALLLLEDVLRRGLRVEKAELLPLAFLLLGVLLPEAFIAGGVLYFLALKPEWRVVAPGVGVLVVFLLLRDYISGLGPSAQVLVLGSFALFTLALASLLKDVNKVDMFEKQKP